MELSGDVGGKRVVVAHRGDVAVMKVEDGREMVDVDLRTDAGEVPSGLGWGFVGGWLLRRWKSAKTAEKNPELAPASLKQLDFSSNADSHRLRSAPLLQSQPKPDATSPADVRKGR